MHQLFCFKSKFPNHFASHLDVTCSCYFGFNLFNYIYIVNYLCSLKCIENIVNYNYFHSY